jgi:hypothetical protein
MPNTKEKREMKTIKPMPSQQELRDLFDYDDDIGALRWKVSPGNKMKIGDIAGTLRKDGYTRVQLDGELYLLHRLIWVWNNGEIPSGLVIDHKISEDDQPKNNRIDNLQLATPSQNIFKAKMRKDNTSGLSGVSWHKTRSKWRAQYRDESGKVTHIGLYTNIFDAYFAYREKAKQIKKDFFTEDPIKLSRSNFNDLLEFAAKRKIRRDQIEVNAI